MMISHLTPYTNLFFLLFLFTDDPTYFIDIRVVKEKFHIFLPTDLPIYLQLYPYTGEGNGTPLQYSCLENPMDGGAW